MERFIGGDRGTAAIFLGSGVPEGFHPDHRDERVRDPRRRCDAAPRSDSHHHGQHGVRGPQRRQRLERVHLAGQGTTFTDVTIALPLLC